jgi:hypothetical protein
MFASRVASAAPIQIGLLTFDAVTDSIWTFNITNLTGPDQAIPPEFPIKTLLTFNVTHLTATTSTGLLDIDGSAFTVDASGNVNCTLSGDAGSGGCNFAAYALSSATLTGTLTPMADLLGLPPGFVGIESTFTATITPGCDPDTGFLVAGCDAAIIEAALVPAPTPAPEPATALLLSIGAVGLLVRQRHRLNRAARSRW